MVRVVQNYSWWRMFLEICQREVLWLFMCLPHQRVSMRFSLSERRRLLNASCAVQGLLVPLLGRLCTSTVFSPQILATGAARPSDNAQLTGPKKIGRRCYVLFFISKGEFGQ